MYEGPRLSHLLAKHIFLDPYHSKELGRLAGFQDDNYLWYSDTAKNLHGGYYLPDDMAIAKQFGKRFFKNNQKFQDWIASQDNLHMQVKLLMDRHCFEKNIDNIPKEKIIELIPIITKIRTELFVHVLSCQPQCTDGLSEDLNAIIDEKIGDPELAKQLFIELTSPEKRSFFTHEELDWLNIVAEAKAQATKTLTPSYSQKIKDHHQKYFLIPASDRTEPWELDHFITLFNNSMQSDEDFAKKKQELHDKYDQALQNKAKILKEHSLPEDSKALGSMIADIGYYRFLSSFYGRWLGYYLVLICRRFASQLGLTFEELSSCDEQELINLLKTGQGVSKQELAERAAAETILIKDGKVNILFGDDAILQRRKELAKMDYASMTEVKGEIASLGKVRGKAFVFYWNDNINRKVHEMPENAILVAPQTHPTYMPAIRKSIAMATDEGGVTGHAAIVARELNKPCVIGLHFITKVVKTGDLIELDGDTGVVRVLKRAEPASQ
jgi:pyruvate,water dikinase